MLSLSGEKAAEIIEAFSSRSKYLDSLLNIDNTYIDMVNQIYYLQLNKANSCYTDLRLNEGSSFFKVQLSWMGFYALPLIRLTGVQMLDFCCCSVSVLILLLSTHLVLSQC